MAKKAGGAPPDMRGGTTGASGWGAGPTQMTQSGIASKMAPQSSSPLVQGALADRNRMMGAGAAPTGGVPSSYQMSSGMGPGGLQGGSPMKSGGLPPPTYGSGPGGAPGGPGGMAGKGQMAANAAVAAGQGGSPSGQKKSRPGGPPPMGIPGQLGQAATQALGSMPGHGVIKPPGAALPQAVAANRGIPAR